TDDAGAYDLTLAAGDDFNVAVRLALSLGAIVVVIGPAQNTNLELARAPGPRSIRSARAPARCRSPMGQRHCSLRPANGTTHSGSPGRRIIGGGGELQL